MRKLKPEKALAVRVSYSVVTAENVAAGSGHYQRPFSHLGTCPILEPFALRGKGKGVVSDLVKTRGVQHPGESAGPGGVTV